MGWQCCATSHLHRSSLTGETLNAGREDGLRAKLSKLLSQNTLRVPRQLVLPALQRYQDFDRLV